MRALSLFSGIGGFDLALKRKGIELIGACEIDKFARQIYEKNFHGIKTVSYTHLTLPTKAYE